MQLYMYILKYSFAFTITSERLRNYVPVFCILKTAPAVTTRSLSVYLYKLLKLSPVFRENRDANSLVHQLARGDRKSLTY